MVATRNNLRAPAISGAGHEAALTQELDVLLALMTSFSSVSGSMSESARASRDLVLIMIDFHYSRIQQERLLLG